MTRGNNAVVGIGTASVTHQVTIHVANPITFQASIDITEESAKNKMIKKSNGPKINPVNLTLVFAVTNLIFVPMYKKRVPFDTLGSHYWITG